MQLIVIYNTHAGRKQKRIRSRIEEFLNSQNATFEIFDYNTCDWQFIQATCAKNPLTRIVVVGGDGTLRRVLEFLWIHNLLSHPVAFVPMGSGNIVAYSLRLPFNMRHAFENALDGTPRPLDLGVLNERHVFFIGAALGKLASISKITERSLKKRLGILAYILRFPSMAMRGDYTSEQFGLDMRDADSATYSLKTHTLFILNHLNVSRLQPRRDISPNDGKLDVITLHNQHYLGLVRAFFGFFWSKGNSKMLRHVKTSSIVCEYTGFKGHMHLDGDHFEYPGSPMEFKVLPGAVSFIV